jgi:hypothetical protein
MTKISSSPIAPRSVAKAIFVPSADQDGWKSHPGLLVRFVWPLPSAFMTKISGLSPCSDHIGNLVKAIRVPSGDQAGPPSSAGLFVKFVWLVPSAFMT